MELTQSDLDALKQIELDILRSFIDVCHRLGLKYYVLGGTMLGAVRHQGFIPWDDDIDVGMLRADYDIFLAKAQELLPEGLFLQTHSTDPAYPANFAKLRDSRTTFVEYSMKNCPINHGIYIDIFPLDAYPDKGHRLFDIRKKLATLRITDAFAGGGMKPTTKLVRFFTRFAYPSVTAAVEARERLFRSVTHGSRIANHCGAWGKKEIVPAHWYGDGATLSFEGMAVSAPACFHEWLTQVYGDYMQLPPKEKRIPHHFVADFSLTQSYIERNTL